MFQESSRKLPLPPSILDLDPTTKTDVNSKMALSMEEWSKDRCHQLIESLSNLSSVEYLSNLENMQRNLDKPKKIII